MIEENIPEGMQHLLDMHRGEEVNEDEVEQDLPDEPALDMSKGFYKSKFPIIRFVGSPADLMRFLVRVELSIRTQEFYEQN